MKSFRPSLTFSILAVLSSILLLNWFLLGTLSFSLSKKDIYAMKARQGRALLATILRSAPRPPGVSNVIESGFSDIGESLADIPDFAGLTLVNQEEKVVYSVADKRGIDRRLAETVRSRASSYQLSPGAREMLVYAPLMHEGKSVGAARLSLALSGEHERLAKSQRLLMSYFILDFLLLLGMGFIFLRRSVIAPMRLLHTSIEKVSQGDYGQTVHVPGSAEIAKLSDSFNSMLETLRKKGEEVKLHVNSLEDANRQLQAAREEAHRSERLASIGLLAAGTAHEIGTPLAAVIGYAGILSDELSSDPENRDYAVRIEQEAGRIDRIVRDLLDYARPARCELSQTAILPLLEETVEMLRGQGAFKGIFVSIRSEEPLPELYIDRYQFQQVLINLLINARDATPSNGSITLHAVTEKAGYPRADPLPVKAGRRKGDFGQVYLRSVESGETTKTVRISIRDSGSGVPHEYLERIFDPFFTTKEPGKGTGLGLSIAARIIDSFGGRITVSSDLGMGSCFTIILPVPGGKDGDENR